MNVDQNYVKINVCIDRAKDSSKGVRLRGPTTKMSETLPGVHPGQVLEVHVGPDTRSVRHLGKLLHSLGVDPSRDSDVGAPRHHGVSTKRLKHQS